MAKIYQTSGIANFRKLTFSVYFRIPTSVAANFNPGGFYDFNGLQIPFGWRGGVELFTFGDQNIGYYSSVNLTLGDEGSLVTPAAPTTIDPSRWDISIWNIGTVSNTANDLKEQLDGGLYDGPYRDDWPLSSIGSADPAAISGHTAYLTSNFTFDRWHHLLGAVDLSTADDIVCHDDGTVRLSNRTRLIEIYFDRTRITGRYYVVFHRDAGIITSADSGPSYLYDIDINAKQFAVPTFPASNGLTVTYNPEIEYAYFQAWFGQYIDPSISSNLEKFVVERDEVIYPPPDVRAAQDEFGASDIWFVRDSVSDIRFEDNQGDGGEFVVVGTDPEDFVPRPEDPPVE